MLVYILHTGGYGLAKIATWLSEKPYIRDVVLMKSPDAFLEQIKLERPELVFIRIGNSDIPGLGIGQMVKAMDQAIRVIFVAEENDCAPDACEVVAYGYLLYPIERENFEKVLFSVVEHV
ncbi:hypothetical protein [Phosphitispora sp. TUW77]|uniref:hypothetical protein n=1 Tax=Phosphitispora sp. TUW77 TaxID=3152361 RepID=UPI003AB3A817